MATSIIPRKTLIFGMATSLVWPYSEDDIHKSIKYSVWASTPNGNQKLNLAFEDAQLRAGDNPSGCPIILFFSVSFL